MNFASYVLNKINDVVTDPYAVKECSADKIKDTYMINSNGLLFMYEIDGYYDLYLTNPHAPSNVLRIFHLSKNKKQEAFSLYQKFGDRLLILCQSSRQCFVASTLQNICSLIRTRSIWSPAHIAVEAGLKDVYGKYQPLANWINSQSCELHYTPLHIACQLNDVIVVQALIQGGADLSKQDDKGNTAVHLAVNVGAERVFLILCEHANKKVLNMENSEGDTALHISAKFDKFKMCKILLDSGANPYHCGPVALPIHFALKYRSSKTLDILLAHDPQQVKEKCKKHGGIPLHWCKGKDQIAVLYQYHTPTEVYSRASHLPLHIMVLRGRLEAAVAIILGHGQVNGKGQNGNTALHLAVKHDYVMLVKMLLLFGADPVIENDFKETPGVLALQSANPNRETIVTLLSSVGCISIQSSPSVLAKQSHFSRNSESSGYKVLCLDGGGIRGLISTQLLMAIEKRCGRKAKDLFDWVSGTSTGGIVALAVALGRDAVEVQRLYFRFKDKVFNGPRPYSAAPFEEFLKKEFGEKTTMQTISHGPKVLITTTLADRKPMQLHLFKNYEGTSNSHTASDENISKKVDTEAHITKLKEKLPNLQQPLWKVARCSGAAPTYFRPMDKFLDGGVIANNPTLDTITEIHRYCAMKDRRKSTHRSKEVGLIVSIGTGCPKLNVAGYDLILF